VPAADADEGHARTSTSSALHRLEAERATGAYTRAGGTLFLTDGQVMHAESSAATGVEVLLTRDCALSQAHWDAAMTEAAREGDVARHLVSSAHVPVGVLELCRRVALYDAAFFVLAPGGGPGRFRPGARHWLGAFEGVAPWAVERESARRRVLLDGIWPDTRLDVLPPGPAERATTVTGAGMPPVPDRRLRVLELADGIRTATDISYALGRPVFHTLVDLRRLAADGLVVPADADTSSRDARPETVQGRPGRADRSAPGTPPAAFSDPDVALLRRLQDALEAL
jgi:hypothetical protein